jgi:hypothetical protein
MLGRTQGVKTLTVVCVFGGWGLNLRSGFYGDLGYGAAQLVQEMRYKSECRGFE